MQFFATFVKNKCNFLVQQKLALVISHSENWALYICSKV